MSMFESSRIDSILVRAPNWIGDAVMSLPAVGAIGGLFPGAALAVLAKPWVRDVYGGDDAAATEVLTYEAPGRHGGAGGLVRLAAELRARRFDLAVLLQNAFEAALIAAAAGIPQRVGFDVQLRGPLLTTPVRLTRELLDGHHVDYYMAVAEALGAARPERPRPVIRLGADELDRADRILSREGIDASVPFVAMAPGASYGPAKRWHPLRFARAATALGRSLGAPVVVFGGPGDMDTARKVEEGTGTTVFNLAGRLQLREFMAVAARSALFLTNDSGPMHIAAALGVPTVAVFGSTDPKRTGPLGAHTAVVSSPPPCSPCFERTCRYGHYDCLDAVSTESVVEAALGLAERAAGRRR